jgi:hypothetical protein
MVELHRTRPTDFAIFLNGDNFLKVPWSELLNLRRLIAKVPAEAADDENYHPQNQNAWVVMGSPNGLILMHSSTTNTLCLSADDWRELARLLYVDDVLLLQTDVAKLSGKARPNVASAIAEGKLFALQVPDKQARQWRIPRRAVQEWLE